MAFVDETKEQVAEKPKLDVLQKEKLKKENIQQVKYQREFMLEQNKLLRAQNERMKLEIESQEISARSWKAWYDKMFYSLECERLEPQYQEYQTRAKERIEQERKKNEEAQQKLQQQEEKTDSIPEMGDLTVDNLQEIPKRE